MFRPQGISKRKEVQSYFLHCSETVIKHWNDAAKIQSALREHRNICIMGAQILKRMVP